MKFHYDSDNNDYDDWFGGKNDIGHNVLIFQKKLFPCPVLWKMLQCPNRNVNFEGSRLSDGIVVQGRAAGTQWLSTESCRGCRGQQSGVSKYTGV